MLTLRSCVFTIVRNGNSAQIYGFCFFFGAVIDLFFSGKQTETVTYSFFNILNRTMECIIVYGLVSFLMHLILIDVSIHLYVSRAACQRKKKWLKF